MQGSGRCQVRPLLATQGYQRAFGTVLVVALSTQQAVRVETMRISFGELACSGKDEHWEVTSWGKGACWVGKTDASNTYSECIRRALVM